MLSAIVLAAGLSKRMGTANKLLLPYKGKTIIERTILNLLDADIQDVIVVTGYEADKITMAVQYLPVRIIYNTTYEKGMTTSIQKGIVSANGTGYMICLGDMYAITTEEYSVLKISFEEQVRLDEKCISIPRYNNEKGNPVIFAAGYKDAILQHTDMEGCKAIVQSNAAHIQWVEMDSPHILEDLDYPEDYKKISNE
jgi:molybdenum cofactor cytidylyltransferase